MKRAFLPGLIGTTVLSLGVITVPFIQSASATTQAPTTTETETQ